MKIKEFEFSSIIVNFNELDFSLPGTSRPLSHDNSSDVYVFQQTMLLMYYIFAIYLY